jgi:hypothetical protein
LPLAGKRFCKPTIGPPQLSSAPECGPECGPEPPADQLQAGAPARQRPFHPSAFPPDAPAPAAPDSWPTPGLAAGCPATYGPSGRRAKPAAARPAPAAAAASCGPATARRKKAKTAAPLPLPEQSCCIWPAPAPLACPLACPRPSIPGPLFSACQDSGPKQAGQAGHFGQVAGKCAGILIWQEAAVGLGCRDAG